MLNSIFLKFIHDDTEIDSFKAKVIEKDLYNKEGISLKKEVTYDAGLAPYSFGYTRVEIWSFNKLEKYFEFSETKYARRMEAIKARVIKPKNALHFMTSLMD